MLFILLVVAGLSAELVFMCKLADNLLWIIMNVPGTRVSSRPTTFSLDRCPPCSVRSHAHSFSASSSSPTISCSFVTLVHLYCQCLLSVRLFNCHLIKVLFLLKLSSILSSMSLYFKLWLITFSVISFWWIYAALFLLSISTPYRVKVVLCQLYQRESVPCELHQSNFYLLPIVFSYSQQVYNMTYVALKLISKAYGSNTGCCMIKLLNILYCYASVKFFFYTVWILKLCENVSATQDSLTPYSQTQNA